LGNGKTVTIETGKLARQADGSVVVSCGDTMLLATAVSSTSVKEGQDFFPLSVEYQEKFSGSGKIPGNFHKRETRPSDYEILTSRLIDRAIRPLFPENYMYDTQVIVNAISLAKDDQPDALAALAASAALTVSDIPFHGPISEVRIARINNEFVINPLLTENEHADIDIMVAATEKNICMVEGEMKECSEEDLIKAIQLGHEEIKKHIAAQLQLKELCGNTPVRAYEQPLQDEELESKISLIGKEKIYKIATTPSGKHERKNAFKVAKEETLAALGELEEGKEKLFSKYWNDLEWKTVREVLLDTQVRLDGRKPNEIRPIWGEINYIPTAHGSSIFTRGETQSLTTVTLGSLKEAKIEDHAYTELYYENFLLNYNFPPFSTNEVKPLRGQSRREVGHGNLAMRSLKNMLPLEQLENYTIRVVSDILESNGSSSMATVCAGSMALMDAGIKMKKPVSGIAMGLITDGERYAVLSDILGDEDHLGDMDFKVTGTADGICGTQMDIKIDGLPYEILAKALYQAKEGRLHILNEMSKAIDQPRTELKANAPKFARIEIPTEFIGEIIGPGGKNIQELQRQSETTIQIEEKDNKGIVVITGLNQDGINMAYRRIKGVVTIPEVGDEYDATVVTIQPYGAFVDFLPGKSGLLHISEIRHERLATVEEVLKLGDTIKVKIIGTDPKTGKWKLSHKVFLPKPERQDKGEKKA